MAQYEIPEGVKEASLDPDHKFIIVSRNDMVSEMLSVVPDMNERPGVGSEGPASEIVRSGHEVSIFRVDHKELANEITVNICVDGEPSLLVALEDGRLLSWDLQGLDAGQLTNELRSSKWSDVGLPIILILVSFVQIHVYAFGPATTWHEKANRPAKVAYQISTLNVADPQSLYIQASTVFWVKCLFTVTWMLIFIFSALAAIPDKLIKWRLPLRQIFQRKTTFFSKVVRSSRGSRSLPGSDFHNFVNSHLQQLCKCV